MNNTLGSNGLENENASVFHSDSLLFDENGKEVNKQSLSARFEVAEVLDFQHTVQIRQSYNSPDQRIVYLNGKIIGIACEGYDYPEIVTEYRINIQNLSDGSFSEYKFFSDPLMKIIKQEGVFYTPSNKPYTKSYNVKVNQFENSDIGLEYKDVENLEIGDLLGENYRFAFYWTNIDGQRVLTNGVINFPEKRPSANEWKNYKNINFAKFIPASAWGTMLSSIEGCFYSGKTADGKSFVKDSIEVFKQKERARVCLERRGFIPEGQCIDNKIFEDTTTVEVGKRILFRTNFGGKPIFMVDSPEYGHALYFFEDSSSASDFANGRITPSEARSVAHRVVHSGDWRNRTRVLVESVLRN